MLAWKAQQDVELRPCVREHTLIWLSPGAVGCAVQIGTLESIESCSLCRRGSASFTRLWL